MFLSSYLTSLLFSKSKLSLKYVSFHSNRIFNINWEFYVKQIIIKHKIDLEFILIATPVGGHPEKFLLLNNYLRIITFVFLLMIKLCIQQQRNSSNFYMFIGWMNKLIRTKNKKTLQKHRQDHWILLESRRLTFHNSCPYAEALLSQLWMNTIRRMLCSEETKNEFLW